MKHLQRLRVVLIFLPILLLCAVPAAAKDAKPTFVQSMLERVELGKPIQGKILILFPLVLKDEDVSLEVKSQFDTDAKSDAATYTEPEFPDKRFDVALHNAHPEPFLVLGGTVLVGGERDRLLRHDCVIAAGSDVQMRALPAASNSDIRKEPVPFKMGGSLAPYYLRKQANFGGSSTLVTTFVARNLEFRNEGDKRKSLAAVGESELLQSWNEEARKKLNAAMKDVENRGKIVGFIASMRGRIQALEIFGSRALLAATGPAYMLGATYSGAAVAIQAGNKKIPLPGSADPAKTLASVTAEAEKLLGKLRKARVKLDKAYPDGCIGERVQIQLSDLTRGRAVGVNGKLVHLAVFPHDPFESRLYGAAVHLPDAAAEADDGGTVGDDGGPVLSDPNRMGLAELSRWARSRPSRDPCGAARLERAW